MQHSECGACAFWSVPVSYTFGCDVPLLQVELCMLNVKQISIYLAGIQLRCLDYLSDFLTTEILE